MFKRKVSHVLAVIFFVNSFFIINAAYAEQVVVYSARIEQLIKPMFDAFTKDTGIKVRYTTDKEGALLARLKAEGRNTPADMLITADAGNLWEAARAGLLKTVESQVLSKNIPAHLRDPENSWFGLSIRARTMVYNTNKINPASMPMPANHLAFSGTTLWLCQWRKVAP